MIAGNPFRRDERQRSGRDRQIDICVKKLARRIGEVGGNANGWSLGMSWDA
jgi:hypothetical protein